VKKVLVLVLAILSESIVNNPGGINSYFSSLAVNFYFYIIVVFFCIQNFSFYLVLRRKFLFYVVLVQI